MITQRSLDATMAMVERLMTSGRSVSVLEGTVLEDLVKANISPLSLMKSEQPNGLIDPTEILTDSKRSGPDGKVEHDIVMEEATKLIAEAINGNLHLTRNVVIPTTKDVYERYNKRLETMAIDAGQPVTIMPNVYHDLWGMSQAFGLVERFGNAPINLQRIGTSMPTLTAAELRSMMKTGLSSLDEVIEDWIDDQGEDFPVSTYRRVFIDGEVGVGRATGATHLTDDGGLSRNDLMAVFLIANGFENELPDGLTIGLDKLRSIMSAMREQAGRAVFAEFKRRERDRSSRNMVFTIANQAWRFSREGRKVVHVNNDVFLEFLENGGSVEAIYGAAISGKSTGYAFLIQDKDALEKTWARHLALHNQRVSAQVYDNQREAARLAMSEYINDQDEADLIHARGELHKRVTEVLGRLQPTEFANDLLAIRTLVCQVLFAHTNAKMMLDAMDTAEMDNPGLNPREYALFATIDMLARWMAAQIKVHYH